MRKFLFPFAAALLAVSCISTKSTLKNLDDNAPVLVLQSDRFVITEISDDPKYGYTPEYPVNIFYKNTRNDSINQPRFLHALAGPKGEEIRWKKLESCCPNPTKYSEMGVGLLDVYELTWDGKATPVRLYLNIYGKGKVMAPKGLTIKP